MPQYKHKTNRRKHIKSNKKHRTGRSIRRTHKYRRFRHRGGWDWPWTTKKDAPTGLTDTSAKPTGSFFGNIFGKESTTSQKPQINEVDPAPTPIQQTPSQQNQSTVIEPNNYL